MVKIKWSTAPIPLDPELALLHRMARQDESALEELYRLCAPPLLAYLVSRLGDPRLAEEVLQDVMLSAWRNASRFRGECRVRTWLLTIARNRAINAYHRLVKPASAEVDLDSMQLSTSSEAPVSYHDLQSALAALPEEQRETLELVFYHGLSQEETARVLKVAPGTVKSRLHRARSRLREWMDSGPEPGKGTK